MLFATILNLFTGNAKKPLIILVLIAVALTALTTGYFYVKAQSYKQGYKQGHLIAEHQYLQAQQKAVAEAIKLVKRKNQANNAIAKAYWQKKLAQQPKIQTIEKRIVKYVEVNHSDKCLLDDDELLILTDLVNIANGAGAPTSKN